MTKSWHSALVLLFGALFLVWTRRDSKVRVKHAALALLGFLPIAAWAGGRFSVDRFEFFRQMIQYDLLSRSSTPLEGHSGPPLTYVQILENSSGPWLAVALAAGCLLLALRPITIRDITRPVGRTGDVLGLVLWVVLVFGAFSAAATKLGWYTTDALPALWIVTGLIVGAAVPPIPAALRVALAIAGALAIALGLGLMTIDAVRVAEVPNAAQSTLASLDRDSSVRAHDIYLDPAAGAWQQSMVAAAELADGLHPQDGSLDGFAASHRGAMLMVAAGSETEQALGKLNIGLRRVVTNGGLYIVERP